RPGGGSIDMGNVSQVVPAIHPYLSLGIPGGCVAHTKEFVQAVGSKKGHQLLILATKALANTVIDLLGSPELLQRVKYEFKYRRL
ncbi:MAG: amidohydrolase, partial [Bacillota bacterium]|nr:amidohydrolase [Bacillota bacterium]